MGITSKKLEHVLKNVIKNIEKDKNFGNFTDQCGNQ